MRPILALICCVAVWTAVPARAQVSALRTLSTADETRGWEAVGRIDLGKTGFCTGTLIAENLVLTAAHCLYDKTTGRPYAPAEMTFLAGWRNGRAAAYRGVRRAVAHPDYVFGAPDGLDRVAFDLAILELDQPIRLPSIRPFQTGQDPLDGETVSVVSYALDRSEAPSIQQACGVLGRQPGVLVLSCDVDFGSSGAPVFAMRDGVPKIVSVVSAKAELDTRLVALGAQMAQPLAELEAVVEASSGGSSLPQAAAASPAVTPGGAKFVKP